jgi:pimeloyl-ACP methyl ester carboxylesterase
VIAADLRDYGGSTVVPGEATLDVFAAGLIPGSRIAVIEGAAHMPNLEFPGAFNAALAGFCRPCNGA